MASSHPVGNTIGTPDVDESVAIRGLVQVLQIGGRHKKYSNKNPHMCTFRNIQGILMPTKLQTSLPFLGGCSTQNHERAIFLE